LSPAFLFGEFKIADAMEVGALLLEEAEQKD